MIAHRTSICCGTAVILACLSLGCTGDSRPDPRDTIKGLFTAIRDSDSAFISQHVDAASAVQSLGDELSGDSAGASGDHHLMAALTGDGALRKRWLDNQIVVGRSNLSADTAWVEVSFIDRLTRVQYYNKMRLEYRHGEWVINSFKTL